MTRVAFITDVHGDVHALRDALAQSERLACDQVVCAGDLLDYGLFPQETIELLMARAIPCVRGNHDRWAAEKGGLEWDLSADAARFLAGLPIGWNAVIEGVRVAVRHGSSRSDMDGLHPTAVTAEELQGHLERVGADVLVVGHTHVAFRLVAARGGVVVNPGALLRAPAVPLELPCGGTFGVLELPSKRFTVYRAADGEEVELIEAMSR